jgi:hypothetical protein
VYFDCRSNDSVSQFIYWHLDTNHVPTTSTK